MNKGDIKRLFIHIAIITVVVVAGAVAAHFSMILFTRHNQRRVVPKFEGLIMNEAQMAAQRESLNIIINDSLYAPMYEGGMVLDQLPKAGVEVKPGRAVYVTINAYGQKRVEVPYVAGRSLRQAKNMLEVAGLQIEKLVYTSDIATNYVLEQYLGEELIEEESKRDALVGSGVTLHVGVSENNPTTRTPQLIGLSLSEAKSRIWESGLNVGRVTMPSDITPELRDNAKVWSQSVERGEDMSYGGSISVNLTLDEERVKEILEYIATVEKEAEKMRQQMEDSLARERVIERAAEEMTRQSESSQKESYNESLDSFF